MPRISQARKDARRSQILAAAMRCFARAGFHATTVHDICAEAELSIGAVYSYFDSKDAIIAALSDAGRRETAAHIEAASGAASAVEQLRGVLSALQRPDSLALHQLDVRAWGEAIGDPALRESYLASQAAVTARLAEVVRPLAIAKGVAPEALGELITAVIAGAMVRRAIEPGAELEPMLATLLSLLRAKP